MVRLLEGHLGTSRSLIYLVVFIFVGIGLEWLFRQSTRVALLRIELQTHETLRDGDLSPL